MTKSFIKKECGCIYDIVTESYPVLCSNHSFNGLINFGRDERFKTIIVKSKITEETMTKWKNQN